VGFRKRPPLAPRDVALVLGITLCVAAIVGGLLVADFRLSEVAGGGGDFYSLWAGSRAFLLDRGSPYSADVAAAAQRLAYGRAAVPGENPYRLTVPFFLLPFFFPFALSSSHIVARGIWLFVGQAALTGSIVLSLALMEWRPPRLFTLFIGLLVIFGLYAVSAMQTGSIAVALGLLYTAILWSLWTGHEELAGSLIALSFMMWEVGAVFLILVAWHVLHEKRWSVLAGLAMTVVILLGVAFLLDPGWMLPFLTSVVGQMRSLHGASTGWIMARLSPQHGILIARLVTIFALSLFIYEWWSARNSDFRRFVWLGCLALAVTPLLGFRTELGNLVVLGPSMVLICAASAQRTRVGTLLGPVTIAAVFLVPWLLLSRWLSGHQQMLYDYLFLFYPLVSVAGLYWTRWWFLRPQRTWIDEVRALRA